MRANPAIWRAGRETLNVALKPSPDPFWSWSSLFPAKSVTVLAMASVYEPCVDWIGKLML